MAATSTNTRGSFRLFWRSSGKILPCKPILFTGSGSHDWHGQVELLSSETEVAGAEVESGAFF